ncbi:MAG TPA: hypothetical protein VM076_11150 [Gemmatimonadaceae bacterium]|nr:hypothetical protein [Gemmatimonadaceae bacterium]
MADLTLAALRRDGDAFMEALSREHYLSAAGHKPNADLQAIYARFGHVQGPAALELTRDAFRSATPGSDEWRSARALLDWQVESYASRQLAELDERVIAWEASAVIRLPDGREVPYQRAPVDMAVEPKREQRLALDEARAALVTRELAPMRAERLQRERDLIESLEVASDYVTSFEALSGIDLRALAAECERFLRETDSMWADVHGEAVRRDLGIAPGEATRADALALMRAPRFDPYFPAREMESVVKRQVTEMGTDPKAGGRIIYDLAPRPGKRARAFCAPVRVPREVYLVLLPHGGATDYRTLLHELGHSLHFGYMRDDLPFEFRWLGDNSITEGYAMLFDHLLHDPGWLARYSALGRPRVAEYRRSAAFEELQFLRRYCAKLLYELKLYSGEVSWSSLPDAYVDILSTATTFRYRAADAFIDVDPRFYSARYLRAWQLQAALRDVLRAQFDDDWFRNPRTGPWLERELFGEGQRELASELAERVGAASLSFTAVIAAIEAGLSS